MSLRLQKAQAFYNQELEASGDDPEIIPDLLAFCRAEYFEEEPDQEEERWLASEEESWERMQND